MQKLPDFHNSCLKLSNMLVSLLYCQPNIYVKFGSDGNSQDILSSNVVLCCYGNTQDTSAPTKLACSALAKVSSFIKNE